MLWNLGIFATTAIIIFYNVIIFKSLKTKKRRWIKLPASILGLIFLVPWTIALVPNVLLLFSPLTPTVKARVVDAETMKPLPNVRVKAAWYREHIWPWGAAKARYKSYDTATNENGEFRVPRTLKPLSLYFPILHSAEYGGIIIFSYDHDYNWQSGITVVPSGMKPNDSIEIAMQPIKADKEYLKNIGETYLRFSSMQRKKFTNDDWAYLIEAHQLFDVKYPNSWLGDENLLALSGKYATMGKLQEAINTLEYLIIKYPTRNNEYAKSVIKSLKKSMESKKGAKK